MRADTVGDARGYGRRCARIRSEMRGDTVGDAGEGARLAARAIATTESCETPKYSASQVLTSTGIGSWRHCGGMRCSRTSACRLRDMPPRPARVRGGWPRRGERERE
eukprot:120882-Pleurochrysis_carterae.AAC.3